MSAATSAIPGGSQSNRAFFRRTIIPGLLLILLVVSVTAACVGAAGIPLPRLMSALGLGAQTADLARDQLILFSIRIPRIFIAIMIGTMLAVSGTVMQGLFRNPLADPGLVGVMSGGALAAVATIVLHDRVFASGAPSFEILPLAAFTGSLFTTFALHRLATRDHRTSVAIFLLAGIAIGALANAGIGLMIYIADDRQLRDVTFWMLGSLAGSTWQKAWTISPAFLLIVCAIPFIARGLDLLVLGESEAFHMGVAVERLKFISIVLIAAATGAAVAVAGIIGFVGIVAPHLLRLLIGPSHPLLLPASCILGAILLLIADTLARIIVAPAEMPIGVLTAAIGAPFFLVLLLRQRALIAS